MSAGLERDLLEQEWNDTEEIRPGMTLVKHIRFYGDEERVLIETDEDEDTRPVFYGRADDAARWLDALRRDIAEADMGDIGEIWDVTLTDGRDEVLRFEAAGFGDLERGYVHTVATRMQAAARARAEQTGASPSPSVIHLEVTDTHTRRLTVPLEMLPAFLRDQLTDGIVSDLPLGDRGVLAILAGSFAENALVTVSHDRVERHVEQRFTP